MIKLKEPLTILLGKEKLLNKPHGGNILILRWKRITRPLKPTKLNVDEIFIEPKFLFKFTLFFPAYHPHSQSEAYYFAHVSNFLDASSST